MPIETAETVYMWFRVAVFAMALLTMGYLYMNFSNDDVFSHPQTLSKGRLQNQIYVATIIMKRASPTNFRYKDAKRRHDAAQAELDRRAAARA